MFKVGQLVIGGREADGYYAVTTSKSVLRVDSKPDSGLMEVVLVSHTDRDFKHTVGKSYSVFSKFFIPLQGKPMTRRKQCLK